MQSRVVVLGIGILIVTAGCLSAPSPTAANNHSPSGEGESEISVTNVSFGGDLEHPDRDGFDGSRPNVQANDSMLLVTGSIIGIGDSACIEITGKTPSHSGGPPTVVIRSKNSPPDGTVCNLTARHWPYVATIAVDGPRPKTITVRHVNSGERIGSWTIAVNTSE